MLGNYKYNVHKKKSSLVSENSFCPMIILNFLYRIWVVCFPGYNKISNLRLSIISIDCSGLICFTSGISHCITLDRKKTVFHSPSRQHYDTLLTGNININLQHIQLIQYWHQSQSNLTAILTSCECLKNLLYYVLTFRFGMVQMFNQTGS